MNDSLAVDARKEIDLRIGAAFTRFQTLRIKSKFQQVTNAVISYGPCQFPTLGFVVERYCRAKNFVSESFWYIQCTYEKKDNKGTGRADFTWKRNRLFDRLLCLVLYDKCMENPLATVTRVIKREKRKWYVILYDRQTIYDTAVFPP